MRAPTQVDLSLAALLLGLFLPIQAEAQIEAFRFDSTGVPVGRL